MDLDTSPSDGQDADDDDPGEEQTAPHPWIQEPDFDGDGDDFEY